MTPCITTRETNYGPKRSGEFITTSASFAKKEQPPLTIAFLEGYILNTVGIGDVA